MFDSQIKETIPIQAYSLRLDIVLSTIRQLITHSRTSYCRNTIMTFAYCHMCAAFAIVADACLQVSPLQLLYISKNR